MNDVVKRLNKTEKNGEIQNNITENTEILEVKEVKMAEEKVIKNEKKGFYKIKGSANFKNNNRVFENENSSKQVKSFFEEDNNLKQEDVEELINDTISTYSKKK